MRHTVRENTRLGQEAHHSPVRSLRRHVQGNREPWRLHEEGLSSKVLNVVLWDRRLCARPTWNLVLPVALEQSQAKVTESLGTQCGIFPLELNPAPCYYLVTLGESEEFQCG